MLREMLQPNGPIDEGQLLTFGARYHLDLPKTYREFMLKNNGGQPVPAAFPIADFPKNPQGAIQAFFGLDAAIQTEDLDMIMADLIGQIPIGILPIACTDGDDFVCIDLRKSTCPIVFWDRKPFWGNNVWSEDYLYPVADSFESFLATLHDA